MKLKSAIFLFLVLSTLSLYCQIDSSKIFYNSKGSLSAPFYKNAQFSIKHINHEESPSCKCLTYISDSSLPVIAIFDGTVKAIKQIEDDYYAVITRFGKYFITYAGVKKTDILEGVFIRAGQEISNIVAGFDDKYELSIYISDNLDNLETSEWFKKL